ncbi:hypothetical protein VP01_3475g3, partial [Puccinia sorghi]
MNNCRPCEVIRGSFHSRHSKAAKTFEEIHLDIVGPINTASREGHRYFLTIVDSCTRARRIGYYPTVIHSDRSA